ncbi:MAG: hypothetical protein JXB24_04565 [Bacteroidales bacterium]|nr:hypothetical protein [Bacteroidales bacterium]
MDMKIHTCFILTIFCIECNIWSQPDTIVAENIYKYEVLDGKRTPKKQITKQNTYDLQGKLIRQIVFGDSLMNIEQYTAFIYDSDKLVSEETFDGTNSIMEIRRYRYGQNHLVSNVDVYGKENNSIALTEKIQYEYDDTLLIHREVLNRKNKWLIKANYAYSENEHTESILYKKGYRKDKLKQTETISYFENHTMIRALTNKLYYTGETEEISIEYEYDQRINKVIKEIWMFSNDTIPKLVEYRYTPEGIKTGECLVDEDRNYLEFTGFERKKHDVIRKEVKMYDLGEHGKTGK